ncbi:MAG: hypothetical protein K0R92_3277 [Lachnospiraceae bacterium]|jgi:hypothetical protein|nr:hypothetical protein [Lachnospiraceae bacterium]
MKKARLYENLFFRVVLLLFILNISSSVLPGGGIQSYGLLGEMTAVSVSENQATVIQSNPNNRNLKIQSKKVLNIDLIEIQFAWITLLLVIHGLRYLIYLLSFKCQVTPVVLKVRMNH